MSPAARGEVIRYPIGHFEVYLGEPFERTMVDILAFLGRHVPVSHVRVLRARSPGLSPRRPTR